MQFVRSNTIYEDKKEVHIPEITERYFLFNCIPVPKKVDDVNSIAWISFFGFRILRLTKEKHEQR